MPEFDKESPVYYCNASLNTECEKDTCYQNGGECGLTSHPEYAFRTSDGTPLAATQKYAYASVDQIPFPKTEKGDDEHV